MIDEEAAEQLIAELLRAIEELAPSKSGNDYRDRIGYNLALRFRAFGLQRDLERLEELIDLARDKGRPEGIAYLEEAFWRVDAACEKVIALLSLGLAIHAVVVKKGRLFFRPNRDPALGKIVSRLRGLATDSTSAARLATIYQELYAARRYRNQVSHSLSAIDNTYLAPFIQVDFDADLNVMNVEHKSLSPEGSTEGDDVSPEALFVKALGVAEGASALLHEAVPLIAKTLSVHGLIERGPYVFCVHHPDGHVDVYLTPPDGGDVSGTRA